MAQIPMRTVRIDKLLWDTFLKRVHQRGHGGSSIIRAALHLYIEDDDNAAAMEEAVDHYGTRPVHPGRPTSPDSSGTEDG